MGVLDPARASMQGPLVEGRGGRSRGETARGTAGFNAGPSRRGPGPWSVGGSGGRGGRFNAGPSRLGPGPPRRRRCPVAASPSFNAGPSRRGPGRPVAPSGPRPRPGASMQGPLVEGRGLCRRHDRQPRRLVASMQGPLVEGRGWTSGGTFLGSAALLQCRALSSRAGADHDQAEPDRRVLLQCRALSSRAGARPRPRRVARDGASMQGPLVEGRGPPTGLDLGSRERGASMQGPLVEGRGAAGSFGSELWTAAQLQCRALSSRAGAPRHRVLPLRTSTLQCRALSSRAGAPGSYSTGSQASLLQCRALSLRAGAAFASPPDRGARRRASMQGPLVEGRGRPRPARRASPRAGRFNAGPSRRGPGRRW